MKLRDSKEIYLEYVKQDALANRRNNTKAHFLGDRMWKFQLLLRKKEMYYRLDKVSRLKLFLQIKGVDFLFNHYSVQLGYSIPINSFGKGLSIAHRGTIVVADNAQIGENCRIHEGVTIGADGGNSNAAKIGNNVFIGTGAKIIGDITIADDVCIGANAVVVKSIEDAGTTWGGVPAHKLSDQNSHANLSPLLELKG